MTVLLFGCPRSGTSILGELFEHLPGFQFYFEPSMAAVKRLDPSWRWALKNPVGPDPTPGLACDLDDLLVSVSKPTAIFIVRHPLDAVCSLRPGMSLGWNHGPVPPHAAEETDPLLRSIAIWNWVNGSGYDALAERIEPLLVHYEDFVARPEASVSRILSHIKVRAENPTAYVNSISDATGGYEAKHQDRWVTDDHDRRVGRWREQMTPEDAALAWGATSAIATRFGYKGDS